MGATDNIDYSDISVDKYGYGARILNIDEITNSLYFEYQTPTPSIGGYFKTSLSPKWLKNIYYNSWTMSPSDDGNMLYILNFDKILNKNATELALTNPVVTIKKNKVSLITKEKIIILLKAMAIILEI